MVWGAITFDSWSSFIFFVDYDNPKISGQCDEANHTNFLSVCFQLFTRRRTGQQDLHRIQVLSCSPVSPNHTPIERIGGPFSRLTHSLLPSNLKNE
ncbi:hypothetical protein TNCV_1691521 [Trichonephila clavipes]|nr:hypothetical protein TNCV_1691521 [Trichonephila clavipes]